MMAADSLRSQLKLIKAGLRLGIESGFLYFCRLI
jgi:hypothetical protein